MDDLLHELGLAELLAPDQRERWRALIASPKRKAQDKALAMLDHELRPDPRYAESVPPQHAREELQWILDTLRAYGAGPSCYVISTWDELHGSTLPLEDALRAICGNQMGTVLSFVPGRLAYYEGEGPNERFILRRTGGTR